MTRTIARPDWGFPSPPDGLCLDFANTRYWRGSPNQVETLAGTADLLDWAKSHAAVPEELLAFCAETWSSEPQQGPAAFETAIAWREAIVATFAATAGGQTPPEHAVAALNAALAAAPGRTEVGPAGWVISAVAPSAGSLLAPVIWSWADLLTGQLLGRVRLCANEACRWLFLDDSKSGNRRWCSMTACGNRAKAHRHYLKRKGTIG